MIFTDVRGSSFVDDEIVKDSIHFGPTGWIVSFAMPAGFSDDGEPLFDIFMLANDNFTPREEFLDAAWSELNTALNKILDGFKPDNWVGHGYTAFKGIVGAQKSGRKTWEAGEHPRALRNALIAGGRKGALLGAVSGYIGWPLLRYALENHERVIGRLSEAISPSKRFVYKCINDDKIFYEAPWKTYY